MCKMQISILSILSLSVIFCSISSVNSGGQIVPLPQSINQFPHKPLIRLSPEFVIIPTGQKCDLLSHAIQRYTKLILADTSDDSCKKHCKKHLLNKILVNVETPCTGHIYPGETSDENYSLQVTSSGAVVNASEIWGALRGLETFSQLVHEDAASKCLQIVQTSLVDYPRFVYRGLMLDTARHFLTKNILLKNLDAMAYSKLNVFHWHISDDPSFPYQSTSFPDLSSKGAYEPKRHVYFQEDVADVIEYARLRGIRVIPEFDTPGHATSWGKGLPGFLTQCYNNEKPENRFGAVDPSKNSTFDILEKLAREWKRVFPDEFLHLGTDEVYAYWDCWKSNPHVQDFMKKMNIKTVQELEGYYLKKLQDIMDGLYIRSQIWEDPITNNGLKPKAGTVVQVWSGPNMGQVTRKGYNVVYSHCWYLNYAFNPYFKPGAWGPHGEIPKYYRCDPQDFEGTEEQKKLVLGGEACMWGSYVDGSNLLSSNWPTAAVVAERLWSAKDVKDIDDLKTRIHGFQCLLQRRGIPAWPVSGEGFCETPWAN